MKAHALGGCGARSEFFSSYAHVSVHDFSRWRRSVCFTIRNVSARLRSRRERLAAMFARPRFREWLMNESESHAVPLWGRTKKSGISRPSSCGPTEGGGV